MTQTQDTLLHVHVLDSREAGHVDYLRGLLAPGVTVSLAGEIPPNTRILVGGRPTRDHLQACPHLQALIIPFAGIPEATRDLMFDFPDVTVHNLHHNAPTTAETALALLLAAAKQIIPFDRTIRGNDWTLRYTYDGTFVLDGKTILILGYGEIGRRVGDACRALGMTVLGIRRRVDASTPDFVHPPEHLHDLLPRSHVLMVCLPGTPETDGMIGARELALMPPGSIVVNVGRGLVIDQAALYHALKDGRLFAAGIDVWYNYPRDVESRLGTAPADYPFHELPNIVMSPHRAGGGGAPEVERRRMDALAVLLNAAASGEPLPYRVDVRAGY